jgi:hypothetical protein
MKITVKRIRVASKREWDRLWSRCEYSTFFHSREWAEVWQIYRGGRFRPLPLIFKFSDRTQGLLPLTWYEPERMYFSSPAFTYGGLVSLDKIDIRHLEAAAKFVQATLGRVFIRTNPFTENNSTGTAKLPFQDDETHVVCLNNTVDHLFRQWSRGHRSGAAKARREGVTVGVASCLEDWRSYYAMYESSLERWGDRVSLSYGWRLFEVMQYLNSSNIKLWLASYRDMPIAGALCFYAKKHVVYWHGAALQEYFHLRPVQLLFHEIIRHAVENGSSWFDFNPSGGHKGVKSFKERFGTILLHCPWVDLEENFSTHGWRKKFIDTRLRISRYIYEKGL